MNAIDRRTFLRGMGAMMALPALERMAPGMAFAASAPANPVRMAFLFVPNGINMAEWTPTATGALTGALPSTLQPLEGVRSSLNVLTGLAQHNAFALGDGPGDHARSTACWLTGTHPHKTSGADIHNGPSVDQVAAMRIGDRTRFASLEIGCERSGLAGDCDSGYSCAYSSNVSWKSATQPVAKEVNPRLVFERLFGNGDAEEQGESLARRRILKQSILDFVSEDAGRLKASLGGRDVRKLDEYFTSVREIETRLERFESAQAARIATGQPRPAGIPSEYSDHIRLMGDMMILAFQADLTRVCTFMFANDGSNRSYVQAGVPEGHHDMSHHGGDPAKLAKKAKIDKFHIEQLAYVLNKMKSIKEGNGTMLDNTMLLYGAGISDGNRHNHDDLPLLMAGGAGGRLKGGRHMTFEPNTPLTNLFLSMLDTMGVPAETLGDSTGKLKGVF
jgi:hypothetical protein